MLGRKSYSADELTNGRALIGALLASHTEYTGAVAQSRNSAVEEHRAEFDPLFFTTLVLALDRLYVHRVRAVAGREGTPVNEVELIVDGLLNNNGVFATNRVVRYSADRSVLGLRPGDTIRLSRDDFERLAAAFFADLASKFSE